MWDWFLGDIDGQKTPDHMIPTSYTVRCISNFTSSQKAELQRSMTLRSYSFLIAIDLESLIISFINHQGYWFVLLVSRLV